MITPSEFLEMLVRNGLSHFIGVPDSTLSGLSTEIEGSSSVDIHLISPNEGTAVALAIGYHLATRKIPVVYMQNSGLGNALNPLVSLAHPEVFGVQMLLIIGWRGVPGRVDEPQHIVQGAISRELLRVVGMNSLIVDKNLSLSELEKFVKEQSDVSNGPFALVVNPDVLTEAAKIKASPKSPSLSREGALIAVIESLPEDAIVVATTGKLSRELSEYRETANLIVKDFLTIGGMGHANAIALAIAMQKPDRTVVCLDGDGAFQMHLGASALIGEISAGNFTHILFNNGIHESVGGQKIAAPHIDYLGLTASFGYKGYDLLVSQDEIFSGIPNICTRSGPNFVEIRVNDEVRTNLKRPKCGPKENKIAFQAYISNNSA